MTTLIAKLLGRLTRKFDRSPAPVLALRLSYSGPAGMTWSLDADVLTTSVGGVIDQVVDLTQFTIGALAGYFAALPGYQILYLTDGALLAASALALVEGAGDISLSNGDHLFAATNPNWAYMSAASAELMLARAAVEALPAEMSTTTADGEWLDLLGSWYAVLRLLDEPDFSYGPRIPAEVILPRQNNTAAAAAMEAATGQPATVTNAILYGNPEPRFDGATTFNGVHFYNASAQRIYNLFDVTIGYALLSNLTPSAYAAAVAEQIDRLRAAGTHMRTLTLGTSVLGDSIARPLDSLAITITEASLVAAPSSADFGMGTLPYLQSVATSANTGIGNLAIGAAASATLAGSGGISAVPAQTHAILLQGGIGNEAIGVMAIGVRGGSVPTFGGSGSFTGKAS